MFYLKVKSKLPLVLTIGLIYFLTIMHIVTYVVEEFEFWLTKVVLVVELCSFLMVNICLWKAVRTNPGRIPDKRDWNVQEEVLDSHITRKSNLIDGGETPRSNRESREFRVAMDSGATHKIIRGVNRNVRHMMNKRYRKILEG